MKESRVTRALDKASDTDIQVKEYTQVLYASDMAVSRTIVYMLTVVNPESGIEYGLGEYAEKEYAEKVRQKILMSRQNFK